MEDTINEVEELWPDLDSRLAIVPGKDILRSFRQAVREKYQVNVTDFRILAAFHREDVPLDMVELIVALERFRTCELSPAGHNAHQAT